MARTKRGTPPSYRRHSSGQACVTVRQPDGRRREILLGPWDSPESKAEYARILAELSANQGTMPFKAHSVTPVDLTVDEVILAFWKHAEQHYRHANGSPTGELDNLRAALRPLRALYGQTQARDFDSAGLEAIQDHLAQDGGLCRTTINARVNRIRRVFRWAARKRLVPVEVVQLLDTVPGLQRGRSAAPEPSAVLPASDDAVNATLPYLPAPVRAMVELQLLTACRPGEVMALRGVDLDRTGSVWTYRPAAHKNMYRGLDRVIHLGPQAQAVVRPFLTADPEAYLFSPRAYVEELRRRRAEGRKTKRTPSEQKRRRAAKPKRQPAGRYNRRSYRLAIVRACQKAGVPAWCPLQLRHTAATTIRAKFGVEAAKVVLGHSQVETTQIYAERDLNQAERIMAEIG